MRRALRLLPGLLLLGLALTPQAPAAGNDPDADSRLKEVERALGRELEEGRDLQQKAAEIEDDLNRMREESVAAARIIQEREADVEWLEGRLEELALEEKDKSAGLGRGRSRFINVLAALERLARRPPEALLVQPLSPTDTVRSAILLRSAIPMIDLHAKRLRLELAELDRARSETVRRRAEAAAAIGELKTQRTRLDGLMNRKAELKKQTDSEQRKATERTLELADQAKNLRDLLKRLEDEDVKNALRIPTPPSRYASRADPIIKSPPMETPAPDVQPSSIKKARGNLPFPVVGQLAEQYGQATDAGLTSKGIKIKTRTGAQVVAPFEGRVVFAGQFRGYGQLLIIEHGEGYHSLLAGMGRIDGVIGQRVLGGEPVGVMGSADSGDPALYVELRRDGRSINPLPWLSARKSKVSG